MILEVLMNEAIEGQAVSFIVLDFRAGTGREPF